MGYAYNVQICTNIVTIAVGDSSNCNKRFTLRSLKRTSSRNFRVEERFDLLKMHNSLSQEVVLTESFDNFKKTFGYGLLQH